MRILIAPTAFKGSLSPIEVANAMQRGVDLFCSKYKADISTDILPLADGGDGTVESIYAACGGEIHQCKVQGAFDEERTAVWLLRGNVAFVELASACGISGWKREQLRPLQAHTRGLGQVINHVINDVPAKKIVVSLGGSASTDGGAGALSMLGAKFFNADGELLNHLGGASLAAVTSCDLSSCRALSNAFEFVIATDVENPLLGPLGAASIFGPQKGCSAQDIELLDRNLARFADVLELASGSPNARHKSGAGAAGGTAFGLAIGLNAEIVSGFDYLADLLGLQSRCQNADLIFAAEGLIDTSTLSGKAVGSLQKMAIQYQKKLWAFSAGSADPQLSNSFENLVSIANAGDYADADKVANSVFHELEKHLGNTGAH